MSQKYAKCKKILFRTTKNKTIKPKSHKQNNKNNTQQITHTIKQKHTKPLNKNKKQKQ